jgi:hypothetical protein
MFFKSVVVNAEFDSASNGSLSEATTRRFHGVFWQKPYFCLHLAHYPSPDSGLDVFGVLDSGARCKIEFYIQHNTLEEPHKWLS